MKTKPILIIAASIILLAGIFLFVRTRYSAKPEKAEIQQFLTNFNNKLNEGDTDSLLTYFDAHKNIKTLKRLINFLAGKKDINGKGKPQAKILLDIEGSTIGIADDEIIASIPANFSHSSVESKSSLITLRIYKEAPRKFKIIQIDVRQFLTDYADYAELIKSEMKPVIPDSVFSPITLEAFKTAEKLKTRYDSVIWFAHIDKKTFFYVVKGKWDISKDIVIYENREWYRRKYKDSAIDPYKIGLINPDLKEIIPPDYDLIHNINGTFKNLVEVEKSGKKGFYNLEGKIVVPVKYDQIFPIEDQDNLAVLKESNSYYYLKKDTTISDKVDLKTTDFFRKIKYLTNTFDLYKNALNVVTEYNSREQDGAIFLAPSYLTDLNMIEKVKDFKNPLRKINDDNDDADGLHESYEIDFSGSNNESSSWLASSFYAIKDYFLGGRSGFYDKKNVIIVDKKTDRIFAHDIETDYEPDGSGLLEGTCDVNSIKTINDTLFEVKSGAILFIDLYDSTKFLDGGPYYHYFTIRNDKLKELPDNRNFGFTKYVKIDDSYLNGCYTMLVGSGQWDKREKRTLDHITPEMLRYMKNEIYADYRYQFKDKRWQAVFADMASYGNYRGDKPVPNNVSVNDSLTEIDKYNINWIVQKLKGAKAQSNTLATK